jgi:hypothetical protein
MGRSITFDHKHSAHTTVALTDERREAIAQISRKLGISQHALLQRWITLGISLYGQDA